MLASLSYYMHSGSLEPSRPSFFFAGTAGFEASTRELGQFGETMMIMQVGRI